MRLKKRQARAALLAVLAIFLYITWCVQADAHSSGPLSNGDFLRFHVIANSNTPEDQALKLLVRDGLLETIEAGLAAEVKASGGGDLTALDAGRARAYVERNLNRIEARARDILAEAGCSHSVSAELGVRWIPVKTYGNVTFPSGNYEALSVTIGEGAGENWWCVLFPPLCLIDGEDPLGLDSKYDGLVNPKEPVTLRLEFKTLELLR